MGSNVPALHDYGEMVCGSCMDKHTFLWQYKKEMPTEDCVMKMEVCSGTVKDVKDLNEVTLDDFKNNTIKADERGNVYST